ncbi:hypothetical protein B4U79_01311 [Dinothrombium tinctorium]|uniref:Uncharacterized protein n=1 Tax=Dinothrombium tinctorium TaxID=1965070 RepID=A0A3S3P6K1_9ACAR|nr:hypothetical protein B4U79_14559 [Dinothrombium tinctorium]RWS15979.1 hypothetical protein B4U79_07138 [Dinothrombium tinctorium]RWS15981.1 hypothetical protein B4U79_13746 [Dinothrombium tinctorium]RWS15988.1 hypothetical protein B4U79_01311 [Dinothrombium tinctorium]
MVYRCLICSCINESVAAARDHYRSKHVDLDDTINGYTGFAAGGQSEHESGDLNLSLAPFNEADSPTAFVDDSRDSNSTTTNEKASAHDLDANKSSTRLINHLQEVPLFV